MRRPYVSQKYRLDIKLCGSFDFSRDLSFDFSRDWFASSREVSCSPLEVNLPYSLYLTPGAYSFQALWRWVLLERGAAELRGGRI